MPPIKWRIISTILDEREAPVDKAILSLKELPLQRASVTKEPFAPYDRGGIWFDVKKAEDYLTWFYKDPANEELRRAAGVKDVLELAQVYGVGGFNLFEGVLRKVRKPLVVDVTGLGESKFTWKLLEKLTGKPAEAVLAYFYVKKKLRGEKLYAAAEQAASRLLRKEGYDAVVFVRNGVPMQVFVPRGTEAYAATMKSLRKVTRQELDKRKPWKVEKDKRLKIFWSTLGILLGSVLPLKAAPLVDALFSTEEAY